MQANSWKIYPLQNFHAYSVHVTSFRYDLEIVNKVNHKLGKLEGSFIPNLDWTPKTMGTYGGLSCCALGGRGGGTSCGGSWHSSKGMGSSSENCFGGRGGGGDSLPSALRGRDLISTVTGRMPGEVRIVQKMFNKQSTYTYHVPH